MIYSSSCQSQNDFIMMVTWNCMTKHSADNMRNKIRSYRLAFCFLFRYNRFSQSIRSIL